MNETDEDVEGTRGHWLQHPYTGKLRKSLETREKAALTSLMNACAQSSDPRVAAAHAGYAVLCEQLIFCRQGAK